MAGKTEKLEKLCGRHVIPNEVIPNDFELEKGDVLEFVIGGLKKEHMVVGIDGEEAFLCPVARIATTAKLVVKRSEMTSYSKRGQDIIHDLRAKKGDEYLVKFVGKIDPKEFEYSYTPYKEEAE